MQKSERKDDWKIAKGNKVEEKNRTHLFCCDYGLDCRMMVGCRIRYSSRYVNVAKQYYASIGRQVDIIKLYGAMELAPVLDLADEIVDIVDTGKTLAANGLEPRNFIADISTRLIVNKASMKMKHNLIKSVIDPISAVVERKNIPVI